MIDRFDGTEYEFLSNFAYASVHYEGILYPTSEHAYQAAKFAPIKTKKYIARLQTPNLAKQAGRRPGLREDWEEVKDMIMYEIVLLKFVQNDEIRRRLLATGEEILVEGNTWHDTYWGQCPVGNGRNQLGITLMRVREELRL